MELESKKLGTAWVTGASGGIGRAICHQLRLENWAVQEITRDSFDLTDQDAIRTWVQENLVEVPELIVCNAGGNIPSNIENLDTENFRQWIENNFLGHLTLVQSVINLMASRGRGKIVFISSIYSYRSKVGRSQYSISKAAQDAYMRSLALEYASKGLIINSVSPGFINTPLTKSNNSKSQISELTTRIPMGRLGDSSEIARVVSFLASESNTYITGQNLVADGGYSLQ